MVRKERRRWERLPLAIPVFVRAHDERGKEFLEFATALNISAGGALVAVARGLSAAQAVSLEIPSSPLAKLPHLPRSVHRMRARVVHTRSSTRYHLLGLKFSSPLLRSLQGKVTSPL